MKKVVLIIALFTTMLVACNNYGKKKTFGKGEFYYTEKVTEDEAQKTGDFLEGMGYLNDEKQTSMQLDKVDSIYKLRLVVEDKFFTDTTLDGSFGLVAALLSSQALDNKPVEVELCDEQLKTKRSIK